MRLDDGTHLSFHEAALVDYAGMWFKRVEGQKFRATLSPSSQGPRVIRDLPFATPWRTIRIADDAAGLVESDLELNLNEPNRSEEHTSELQSLMRISYAVFCLKKKIKT